VEALICCKCYNQSRYEDHRGPLRVVMVTDYMPPQTHGISTHSHGLIEALRSAGNEVDVFTTCGEKGKYLHHNWSAVNLWNTDVRLSLWPCMRFLYAICFQKVDVVHIILPSLIVWPLLIPTHIMGVPTLCSFHCREDIGDKYVTNIFLRKIALAYYAIVSTLPCYLLANINATLTYGFMRDHYMLKRLHPRRVATAPSSMDAELFVPDAQSREETRRELCASFGITEPATFWVVVSRLAPEKDLDDVLDALAVHQKTWPNENLHLFMVGDGPSRVALEKRVAAMKLPAHFLGMYKHDRTPLLYNAADVCITCSTCETFGLTILEALSCGVPHIMPHCPVFDELYADTISEWMYTKGDSMSLAMTGRSAARGESRSKLAELREKSAFGPSICWSWEQAAIDQSVGYRRAICSMRETRNRLVTGVRILLVVTSLILAVIVIGRSVCPAGYDVWYGIADS